MIVTVTLNPAVDKTAHTEKIVPGGLNRLSGVIADAGGKGVNVSKMIAALGGSSVATGFLGSNAYGDFTGALGGMGIGTDFVAISAKTRTNLKIISPGTGVTELNEPGPDIEAEEIASLTKKLTGYAKPGSFFAFSGSLPPGVSPETYREIIGAVKERGAAVFLDADGEVFRAALEARPDYVKPNIFELAQHFGADENMGLEQAADLCGRLIRRGVKMVALSMGEKGALFVTEHERLRSPGLAVSAKSTVGAGDSMVGAILHASARGMPIKETAALAMAASAGAVTTEGTKPPARETVDRLLAQVTFQGI